MRFLLSLFRKKDLSELTDAIREGALLVDVRGSDEFARGSVQGAINIPLHTLEHQLDKLKSEQNIVVFCQSGNRSSLAKRMLTRACDRQVIDGGSWKNVEQLMSNQKKR